MYKMEQLFFMRPLLGLLAQGRYFCRGVAIVVRVSAAMLVLFSLATFFQAGKTTFELPAQGIPGGALFECFFVVAVYAAVHVLLIRAREIESLPGGEFFALPLGAVLARLIGEAYSAFVSLVAVGGGVFVWFTNQSLSKIFNPVVRALFPVMRDDPSFMGGIEFMIVGVLTGLAALIVSYVVAEILAALARLAQREVPGGRHVPVSAEHGFRSRFGS
jgi:hypothetical protein